jgi:hypothetical protein
VTSHHACVRLAPLLAGSGRGGLAGRGGAVAARGGLPGPARPHRCAEDRHRPGSLTPVASRGARAVHSSERLSGPRTAALSHSHRPHRGGSGPTQGPRGRGGAAAGRGRAPPRHRPQRSRRAAQPGGVQPARRHPRAREPRRSGYCRGSGLAPPAGLPTGAAAAAHGARACGAGGFASWRSGRPSQPGRAGRGGCPDQAALRGGDAAPVPGGARASVGGGAARVREAGWRGAE